MKRSQVLLSLCLLLWAGTTAAQESLTLNSPMIVGETPLTLAIELEAADAPRQATISVDGKVVGNVELQNGANEVKLDKVRVAAGSHDVQVQAGSLSASTGLSLLPGWLSITPPLVAIILALIFRDVLIALFLGIFGGAWILVGWNPFAAFGRTIDHFIVPALIDEGHASILVFTCMLGGMVGLITKGGGTHGIVEMLSPYATSRRRGQLATWFMGVVVFFDDYANTLIVGPTMRPITDKLRISREKLAYIVDSTAAPVVCLFPISTWVGFELGLIGDAFSKIGLDIDPYSTFVATIPFRFYPFFALALILALAIRKVDFGPMRKAEKRAMETGQVLDPDARPIADYSTEEVEPPAGAPKRAFNALIPIAVVTLMTVIGIYMTGLQGAIDSGVDLEAMEGGERMRTLLANADSYKALLWASLSGLLSALLLVVSQKILKIQEGVSAMVAGIKAMFLALMVLTLSWALASVCSDLKTADYLVGLSEKVVSPGLLPALTFVLAAAIAFATGSSWGTMGILEPLVIPIAHALSIGAGHEAGSETYLTVMFASIASVLTGSVWGDHCSPISDTTILSSTATGCDHIAHVRTQLPYALFAGFLAILVGSLPAANGMSPWLSLLIGFGIIITVVVGVGKMQRQKN